MMFEVPHTDEVTNDWPAQMPPHPRLLAGPGDWTQLRRQIETDPPSRQIWNTIRLRAETIVTEPVLQRVMTGRLLLMVSRQALERISVLAMADRISGDRRFGERAIAEMLALCAFSDWNPAHFLDTAELSLAIAIGYDWLHELLSPDETETIADALMKKGIGPSLDTASRANWWLNADENWVQVCHGGLAAAAIAIADRDANLARYIVSRAIAALPGVANRYAPHGAYPEGPMYWSYGTAYHIVLAAALQRFTGSTQGVDAYAGFAESAEYINRMTAPSGDYFNYADCAPERRLQAQLFWMAARFARPGWLAHDIDTLSRDLSEYAANPGVQYWYYDMVPLALLWRRPAPVAAEAAPPFWTADGPVPVACYRWGDRAYLGIKGGAVGLSHSHMDVGSFVFEAGGERWAIDTGMQDYESLESAGVDLWNEREADSQRWQVFRIGADSHNILRFDGADQPLDRSAGLRATDAGCIVDLAALYPSSGGTAEREFAPTSQGFDLIDRWQGDTAVVATSQWLTRAKVERAGAMIMLHQGNRRLRLDISGSDIDRIEIEDVSAPRRDYDAPNPGLTRIVVRAHRAAIGNIRIVASLA